jgi:hypothetical protein
MRCVVRQGQVAVKVGVPFANVEGRRVVWMTWMREIMAVFIVDGIK